MFSLIREDDAMHYKATTTSMPVRTKILRVDFTPEEWRLIARVNGAEMRRGIFAMHFLGLAGIAAALFCGVTGIWKWVLLGAGVLFILFAIPGNQQKKGLDPKGGITDREAADRFASEKLKAWCKKEMGIVNVAPEEEIDGVLYGEKVPLSAFIQEETAGSSRLPWIILPVMLCVDAVYFLIWRGNVVGSFVNAVGIAACALSGAFLLGWALGDTKSGRKAALITCLCLALIGAGKVYTQTFLEPAALRAAYGPQTLEEETGDRSGLLVVREYDKSTRKVIHMPLGDPKRYETIAIAGADRVVDRASYGNTGRAKGYAYGCETVIIDGATRRRLGTVSVDQKLPDKITGGAGDYVTRPSDGKIVQTVLEWLREKQ